VELQSRLKDLQAQGIGVASISYDGPDVIAAFAKQNGITFPMLSDKASATIKRYGILNPLPQLAVAANNEDAALKPQVQTFVSAAGNASERMIGIAFPGTFMIDRQGKVTSRFFEDSYIERITVSSLMLKAGAGDAPVSATKASTKYFDLTTYPSDAAVAPGNRITLAIDIVPKPGMHVYAPGADSYRVITLNVADQPFIRPLDTHYPASEIYFFEPLNERVPVYQKPFTLLREVVVEGSPQAQAALKGKETVTISGSLDYQACDDTICYNPGSLPLSWTVSLRPLVFARPQVQPQP
jgi:hypothetical protein